MVGNRALAETPVGDFAHFNERRGFERIYYQNQEAQSRAAKFLIGVIALHEEFGNVVPNSPEVAAAARVILKDLVSNFPEFMAAGEVHNDFGGGIYAPDEQLLSAVRNALTDTSEVE